MSLTESKRDAYLLFALTKLINSRLSSSNIGQSISATDEINLRRRHLRRKRFVLLLSTVVLNSIKLIFRERRLWQKVRSSEWWDRIVIETWCAKEWKDNLRVDRTTFQFLCQQLQPYLIRKRVMREPISVERRLALTLVKLGSSGKLRTVADLFGIARSTTCEIVAHVCQAIHLKFKSYISFPAGDSLKLVVDRFLDLGGLPGCCGVIDSTHIPIKTPRESFSPKEYYNKKGFYSVILQAVVDDKERFMNVSVVSPGSASEIEAFTNSSLFKEGDAGKLFTPELIPVPGTSDTVKSFIVGSSAFPLLPWLITPFRGELSKEQEVFNHNVANSRTVVKQAFNKLKGRWRSLLKDNDSNLTNIERQVLACCYLHNICIECNDEGPEEWYTNAPESGIEYCCEEANLSDSAKDLQNYLMQWSFANVHEIC